ncbi:MAG: hypothetical protein Q8R76_13005 [Candidatus Omnitrophota bacterium]|nr:hypothetical protein [Candidatus Omnitrophota bacterium]
MAKLDRCLKKTQLKALLKQLSEKHGHIRVLIAVPSIQQVPTFC